jgi:hypothetical protein
MQYELQTERKAMNLWLRSIGIALLGICLLAGYCVDIRWALVVMAGSLGSLFSCRILASRLSWPISTSMSMVGGAVGTTTMECAAFPLFDIDTPPHLAFILMGCGIGLVVSLLLAPRHVEHGTCNARSCIKSSVTVVVIAFVTSPIICLASGGGMLYVVFSPFVGGIAGLALALPFLVQALRCTLLRKEGEPEKGTLILDGHKDDNE